MKPRRSAALVVIQDRQPTPPPTPDQRPRTRGDCKDGVRPCPWFGCRHNLIMEVTDDDGIVFNSGRGLVWTGAKPRTIGPKTTDAGADHVLEIALRWWNDEVIDYDRQMARWEWQRFLVWAAVATAAARGVVLAVEPPPEPRLAYSCVLDVIDDRGWGEEMLLDDIGEIMHVTRERVRQVEIGAERKLKTKARSIAERLGWSWSAPVKVGTVRIEQRSLSLDGVTLRRRVTVIDQAGTERVVLEDEGDCE